MRIEEEIFVSSEARGARRNFVFAVRAGERSYLGGYEEGGRRWVHSRVNHMKK